MSGRALFVTGAGTGVGKTWTTAALARALRAGGRDVTVLKPVLSGFDPADPEPHDAAVLAAAAGDDPADPAVINAIAPWRFRAPLSPDMAAAREGRVVPFADVVTFCRWTIMASDADCVVLIEGVGGTMVPLDADHTVRDWIAALGIPALLVGGTYLGAISHVLTARASLAAVDVPIDAIALSESPDNPVPPAETRDTVARHADPTLVHLLRRDRDADAALLAARLFAD